MKCRLGRTHPTLKLDVAFEGHGPTGGEAYIMLAVEMSRTYFAPLGLSNAVNIGVIFQFACKNKQVVGKASPEVTAYIFCIRVAAHLPVRPPLTPKDAKSHMPQGSPRHRSCKADRYMLPQIYLAVAASRDEAMPGTKPLRDRDRMLTNFFEAGLAEKNIFQ